MAQWAFANTDVSAKDSHMSPCAHYDKPALHGKRATCKTAGSKFITNDYNTTIQKKMWHK